MAVTVPIGLWLLLGGRKREAAPGPARSEVRPPRSPLVRAMASLALVVSAPFAWLGSLGEPEQPSWRDDSMDDWRSERDAEREAERQARARTHRDS